MLLLLYSGHHLSIVLFAGNKTIENRPPFNNEAYSAFKRGNVVKGILCPSLTNSFKARSLERSYLTYSHRQRQKSLLIVNIVDLVLKIVLAIVWTWRRSEGSVCRKTIEIHRYIIAITCNYFFEGSLSGGSYMVGVLHGSQFRNMCFGMLEMFRQ